MNPSLSHLSSQLTKGQAALVSRPVNRRYLTGFASSDGFLVVFPDQQAVLLVDSRYQEAAEKALAGSGIDCQLFISLYDSLNQLLEQHQVEQLLIEAEGTTVAALSRLREHLQVDISDSKQLDEWIAGLRMVKTPEQVRKIQAAQALTEYAFAHILTCIAPGKTERELALELEFAMRKQGADGVAFDIIVVSGENSSMPHGVPGNREIQPGDLITLDFGARLDGWHSDMTRTVAVGHVSEEQRQVYQTVLAAQQACLQGLRAGMTGEEGDKLAREVIAAAGYGDYFGHSTGHGVGMEVHEEPRLSPRAKELVLAPGHVVTVEPGIYLPGRFGVRIEDMVLITEEGCRNLTGATKELLIL